MGGRLAIVLDDTLMTLLGTVVPIFSPLKSRVEYPLVSPFTLFLNSRRGRARQRAFRSSPTFSSSSRATSATISPTPGEAVRARGKGLREKIDRSLCRVLEIKVTAWLRHVGAAELALHQRIAALGYDGVELSVLPPDAIEPATVRAAVADSDLAYIASR